MKKSIVTYHAPAEAMKQSESTTKEDMEQSMKAWMDWAAICGESLVDMGLPLMGGQKLKTYDSSANSDREVCGYSVIQAADMAGAKALMKGHPHLSWDGACEIEIHEAAPLPGM